MFSVECFPSRALSQGTRNPASARISVACMGSTLLNTHQLYPRQHSVFSRGLLERQGDLMDPLRIKVSIKKQTKPDTSWIQFLLGLVPSAGPANRSSQTHVSSNTAWLETVLRSEKGPVVTAIVLFGHGTVSDLYSFKCYFICPPTKGIAQF